MKSVEELVDGTGGNYGFLYKNVSDGETWKKVRNEENWKNTIYPSGRKNLPHGSKGRALESRIWLADRCVSCLGRKKGTGKMLRFSLEKNRMHQPGAAVFT